MTDIDPRSPADETRVVSDPVTGVTEVTRTKARSGAAAWWVAGAVTVVAIIAIAVMVTRQSPAPSDNPAIAAAAEQGRVQGMSDVQAADAQASAQASAQSAQAAAAQSQANQQAALHTQLQAAPPTASTALQDGRPASARASDADSTDNGDQPPPQ